MEAYKTRSNSRNSAGQIHNSDSNQRRHSLTAQLTRSARRFSAAFVPQFTKLDPIPILQKYLCLKIRIIDIRQVIFYVNNRKNREKNLSNRKILSIL